MSRRIWVVFGTLVVSLFCVFSRAQSQTDDQLLAQLRAQTPQSVVDLANEAGDGHGNPDNIEIVWDRADLNGTGEFNFVVAAYQTTLGGTMRVFRQVAGALQVVTDLDPTIDIGGPGLTLELVDVDNDGKPEIVTTDHGANVHFTLGIFKWTGSDLAILTPGNVNTTDSDLFDVDKDGVLEILTPPDCTGLSFEERNSGTGVCKGDFKVYKFNGSEYTLAFTSATDPTGRSAGAASGVLIALPREAVMNPDSFPLLAITQARTGSSSGGGVVTVRLSDLIAWVAGIGQQPLDVNDIDPSSLVLGRNIRPISTLVVPPSSTETTSGPNSSASPFLQAQFDRQAVLTFLPKVQLNKPLAVGDSLTLPISGKMKNGVPLQAGVTVKIVAP